MPSAQYLAKHIYSSIRLPFLDKPLYTYMDISTLINSIIGIYL